MLGKLWVAQDLFAELQAVSVLLVLVTSLRQKRQSRLYIRAPPGCCTTSPRIALGKSASSTTCPCCWHHMHQKHCLLNSPVSMRHYRC